jgi:lysine biosynthesis protein LysW
MEQHMKNQTYNKSKSSTVACLSCGDAIQVSTKAKLGSVIVCDGCEAELIIVNLNPLLVEWPDFDADYVDLEDDEFFYDDLDEDDDGDYEEDDPYEYDEDEDY